LNVKINLMKSNKIDNIEEDSNDDISRISWFCSLKGNEWFCEVDEEYIQDDFNLYGLSSKLEDGSIFEKIIELILDLEGSDGTIYHKIKKK
jgi:casein kinase II subunit beta